MLFQKTVFLVALLIHLRSTSRQHWSRRRLESTMLDSIRYMALACVYLCHLCFTVVASVNSVNLHVRVMVRVRVSRVRLRLKG